MTEAKRPSVEQALRSLCANKGGSIGATCLEQTTHQLRGMFMSLTWNPKRIPRRRKHGFLARMATSDGRRVLKSRRDKGRWKLSVSNERRYVQRGHR